MRIIQSTIKDTFSESSPFFISLNDGGETYISSLINGKELKQRLIIFRPLSNYASNVLDYSRANYDGVDVKRGGEDAAPYRILGTTIGANHGYYHTEITCVSHGKETEDIGSVWNDGSGDRLLVGITDGDKLQMQGTRVSTVNFTHVSGATNTAPMVATGWRTLQMYPAIKNRSIKLEVDGVQKSIANGSYNATSDIVITETYEIMTGSSIMAWMAASVGTLSEVQQYDGEVTAIATNKIRYTRFGNTLDCSLEGLKDGIDLNDIMFVMGYDMIPSIDYPNLRAYIPKTLPFTQDGNTFDFANIEPVNYLPLPVRIGLTADRTESGGQLADRHLYLLDGLGFSMGYLPILDADPAIRRSNAPDKALELATSGKIYMSAIDGGADFLNNGDFYRVIAYKEFFVSSEDRTAYYVVDSGEGDFYLYVDWHNLPITDVLEIPLSLVGKTITEVEKSSNVNYTGGVLGSTLEVYIDATESYGYLILKL